MTNEEIAAALNKMGHLVCRHWQFKRHAFVDPCGIAKPLHPTTARMVVIDARLVDEARKLTEKK